MIPPRHRSALALTLLLATCRAGSDAGETAGSDEAPPLLPDLPPAIDLDPDPAIVEVELRAREAEVELVPGVLTRTLAYVDGAAPSAPARHPGPLVVAERGQTVRIRLVNELPQEATTLHLHGVRLAAAHDGNPVVEGGLFPGETRTYEFIAGDPGLYWYHPHLNTPAQMIQGLKGPLLVRDPGDPEVDADRVIFIDAIRVSADGGTIPAHDESELLSGRVGDRVLVNGAASPRARAIAGGRERWRLVNASNARTLALRRGGGGPWTVIGGDGGPLPSPRGVEVLWIAPGERHDLLIDVADEVGGVEVVIADAVDQGHGVITPSIPLLEVEAIAGIPTPTSTPEAFTRPFAASEVDPATPRRRFTLSVDDAGDLGPIFLINGESWPFNQPIVAVLGERELWEIVNEGEGRHPFHVHGLFFQVLAGGSGDPTIGWKDTIDVGPGETRLLIVEPSALGRWLFHCQIPIHAERGMMGDLIVLEVATDR